MTSTTISTYEIRILRFRKREAGRHLNVLRPPSAFTTNKPLKRKVQYTTPLQCPSSTSPPSRLKSTVGPSNSKFELIPVVQKLAEV